MDTNSTIPNLSYSMSNSASPQRAMMLTMMPAAAMGANMAINMADGNWTSTGLNIDGGMQLMTPATTLSGDGLVGSHCIALPYQGVHPASQNVQHGHAFAGMDNEANSPNYTGMAVDANSIRLPPTVLLPCTPLTQSMPSEPVVSVSVEGMRVQYQMTADDLSKVFNRYGIVTDIHLFEQGKKARVSFEHFHEAHSAMHDLDGKVLNGLEGTLRVSWVDQEPHVASPHPITPPESKKVSHHGMTPPCPEDKDSKSLPDEVQCAICWDVFIDPGTLPCGHSFCSHCLQRVWDSTRAPMPCPTCRKPAHHLPPVSIQLRSLVQRHYTEAERNRRAHLRAMGVSHLDIDSTGGVN